MRINEYESITLGDYIIATAISSNDDMVHGSRTWDGYSAQINPKWRLKLIITSRGDAKIGLKSKFRVVKIDKNALIITAINSGSFGSKPFNKSEVKIILDNLTIFEQIIASEVPINELDIINKRRLYNPIRKVLKLYTSILSPKDYHLFEVYNGMNQPNIDECYLIRNILQEMISELKLNNYSQLNILKEELLKTNIMSHISSFKKYLESYDSDKNMALEKPMYGKDVSKTILDSNTVKKIMSLQQKEKLEWANSEHEKTLNILKENLKQKKYVPEENIFIDCYAQIQSGPAIFEIKSLREVNELHQIRAAISQLYEYRYRHNIPKASLWLVLSKKPDTMWIIDYLLEDRKINVLWVESEILVGPSLKYL